MDRNGSIFTFKKAYFHRCEDCVLFQYRRCVVPGHGPMDAEMVVVGQNPGKREDEEGLPFIGKAGKVLTRCMKLVGIKRSLVRITNAVHCLTPSNRSPSPTEISSCRRWLDEELGEIGPKVVVAAGRVAMMALDIPGSVRANNGVVFEKKYGWGRSSVIPMIHPAAALYGNGKDETRMMLKALRNAKKQMSGG